MHLHVYNDRVLHQAHCLCKTNTGRKVRWRAVGVEVGLGESLGKPDLEQGILGECFFLFFLCVCLMDFHLEVRLVSI